MYLLTDYWLLVTGLGVSRSREIRSRAIEDWELARYSGIGVVSY